MLKRVGPNVRQCHQGDLRSLTTEGASGPQAMGYSGDRLRGVKFGVNIGFGARPNLLIMSLLITTRLSRYYYIA